MDNASLILETLDGHVNRPARLILYGRAALQLGFREPPTDIAESKDVDGIVPLGDLEEFSANDDFWNGQEATNAELRSTGLYITHLFRADQIFLRRDWEAHLVPIERPATPSSVPSRWSVIWRGRHAPDSPCATNTRVMFCLRVYANATVKGAGSCID